MVRNFVDRIYKIFFLGIILSSAIPSFAQLDGKKYNFRIAYVVDLEKKRQDIESFLRQKNTPSPPFYCISPEETTYDELLPSVKDKLDEMLCKYLGTGDNVCTIQENSSVKNDDFIVSELASDPELVVVAEMFIERLGEALSQMREAFENNDMKTLKDLTHEIKGAGGSAGFGILTEKCAAMEPLILDNKIEDVKVRLADFFELCKKVRAKQPA